MAVRLEFESLDQAPEALRDTLVESDGRFVFEAEPAQDVLAMRHALVKERDAVRKELRALQAKVKDVDPDKYQALLQAEQSRADEQLKEKGQVEELIAQRIKRAKDEWDSERTALSSQLGTLNTELDRLMIDADIAVIAPKCGAEDTAIDIITMLARQTFRRVDGKVLPYGPDGNVIYGKDGQPMSKQEWLGELAKERPILFRRSTGSGSSAASTTSAGGTPRKPVSQWTAEEKREFVDKNGLASWERLVAEAYANPTLPGTPAPVGVVKH